VTGDPVNTRAHLRLVWPHLAALAALGLLGAGGCAGSQLESASHDVQQIITYARDNGAYRCAPELLAVAETEAEFAAKRLDHGDYFGAKEHLRAAESAAREAYRLSPKDVCTGKVKAPKAALAVTPKAGDRDGDGFADDVDRCPDEPEDKDGFEDDDGCADLDNDQDGVPDAKDQCPKEAEDRDGFQDEDGCPEPDNDQDGILDAADACPMEPEDRDGFEDHDGCPEPDNDKDGIVDGADRCPNEPGTADNGGCPKPYTHIVVTADKIELKQKIFFDTARSRVQPRSFGLLDEVAEALKARPAVRVRIEGHTDSRGSRKTNTKLSAARANAVRDYLIAHGIEADRLDAMGFGPDQPIDTNKTAAGRERNRRVEFVLLQSQL